MLSQGKCPRVPNIKEAPGEQKNSVNRKTGKNTSSRQRNKERKWKMS